MKLIWCSDIHLNFLDENLRTDFYEQLKSADGNIIVISGDIAESHNVDRILMEMKKHTNKDIYFVLGNHDYYGSSVEAVKNKMRRKRAVHWLGKGLIKMLDDHTALIGVDGWGDCRNGDVENSRLVMNDWIYIEDLKEEYMTEKSAPSKSLQQLADADAELLGKTAQKAIQAHGATKVIIVTHVPPFAESCRYAGRKSTSGGLPFFSSQILGLTMLNIVEANPSVEFLWLCGHTHSKSEIEKRNNFTVKVAASEYYSPQIAEVINV